MGETAETTRSARTVAILDQAFLVGLEALSTDEVRRRRDQALAEREFQSYLRRLVQVRQDILTAERDRRREGGTSQSAVERVTAALSGGPKPKHSRGEALRTALTAEDMDEAERQADAVVDLASASTPEDLTQDQLERSLAALTERERIISADRLAVMRVHDRLQEELKRRYREDPSQIPQSV